MKAALYKMENNKYLGNCFNIIVELDDNTAYGLTRNEIVVLIKTSDEKWEAINTLEELKNTCLYDDENEEVYLRIGSECMLGVFGDSHCNCEQEREAALKKIGSTRGVYIHLPQEAQGNGLLYKAKELNLQVHGYMPNGLYIGAQTQSAAAAILTGKHNIDKRTYKCVETVMDTLKLDRYQYVLMSRNPRKVKDLKKSGVGIVGMYDIMTKMTTDNMGEYLVKWINKKYCFTLDEVIQVIELIENKNTLVPDRAGRLLETAADMLQTKEGVKYLEKHLYVPDNYKTKLFELISKNYTNKKIA